MPGRHQLLRIERRAAGQQFVEQHAQAVDVAARVDVQPAHLRLLRAHVSRRADELVQTACKPSCPSAALSVALAMPKSITFGTGTPSCSVDQDVRRLDVAVDDPLLVRVLDRLADLDEQIEPLLRWRDWSGRSTR